MSAAPRPPSLMDRIRDSGSRDSGSIPLGGTNMCRIFGAKILRITNMYNKLGLIKVTRKMLVAISSSLILCCPGLTLNAQPAEEQLGAHATAGQLNAQTVGNKKETTAAILEQSSSDAAKLQQSVAAKPQQSSEEKLQQSYAAKPQQCGAAKPQQSVAAKSQQSVAAKPQQSGAAKPQQCGEEKLQQSYAAKPQQRGEEKTWTLTDARRVKVFRQRAVKQYIRDSMEVLVARCQKVLNSAYMAQELEKTVTDVPGYEGYPVKLYTYYMRSDVKTHADKKGRVMLLMPDAQKLARWTISACWKAVQSLDYKYTQKLLNYVMRQNGGQFAVRGVVYEDMYTRGYYEPYVFKDGITVYVADPKMVATDSTLKWCTDAMLEYYLRLDNSQLKPYSGRFARISSTTREMYYEYNGVTNYKEAFNPKDSQGAACSKDSQSAAYSRDSQSASCSKNSQSAVCSKDSQSAVCSRDSQSACCIKNSYGKVINVGTGDSHETRSLVWLNVVRKLYLKAWKSDDNELVDAWAWWVFVNHVGEEL